MRYWIAFNNAMTALDSYDYHSHRLDVIECDMYFDPETKQHVVTYVE